MRCFQCGFCGCDDCLMYFIEYVTCMGVFGRVSPCVSVCYIIHKQVVLKSKTNQIKERGISNYKRMRAQFFIEHAFFYTTNRQHSICSTITFYGDPPKNQVKPCKYILSKSFVHVCLCIVICSSSLCVCVCEVPHLCFE